MNAEQEMMKTAMTLPMAFSAIALVIVSNVFPPTKNAKLQAQLFKADHIVTPLLTSVSNVSAEKLNAVTLRMEQDLIVILIPKCAWNAL